MQDGHFYTWEKGDYKEKSRSSCNEYCIGPDPLDSQIKIHWVYAEVKKNQEMKLRNRVVNNIYLNIFKY